MSSKSHKLYIKANKCHTKDTKGKIRGDKSKKGTQHRKLKSNTPPIRNRG